MLFKVIGFVLAFLGFLILKFFPGMREHQPHGFTLAGILMGLILILVGIGLIVFG